MGLTSEHLERTKEVWRGLPVIDRAFLAHTAAFGLSVWVTGGRTADADEVLAWVIRLWPAALVLYLLASIIAERRAAAAMVELESKGPEGERDPAPGEARTDDDEATLNP